MPEVTISIPLHMKAGVERYLKLMQAREKQLIPALKARVIYSLTCHYCGRFKELDSVTEQEAQEILLEIGWRQLVSREDWKLKPACPMCACRVKNDLGL